MKVSLVYVFPTADHQKYIPAARDFTASYVNNPPGLTDHDLHVIVNGEKAANMAEVRKIFEPLTPSFHAHNNYAKDLGAFLFAAHATGADLLVCLGAHIRFICPLWLDSIVHAYGIVGPCVMGPWAFHVPEIHIRTTFFCIPAEMLLSYPYDFSDRYGFEHGRNSITLWSQRKGFEPWQITRNGLYSMKHFHPITRDETLAWDQHCDRDLGQLTA